jgi:hypothetical protein
MNHDLYGLSKFSMRIVRCADKVELPVWVSSTNWGILWCSTFSKFSTLHLDYYIHHIQVQFQSLWPLWQAWKVHFQKWEWENSGFLGNWWWSAWYDWGIHSSPYLIRHYLAMYIEISIISLTLLYNWLTFELNFSH